MVLIGQFYINAFVLLPLFLGRNKIFIYCASAILLFLFNFTVKYLGGEFLLPFITGKPSSVSELPIVHLALVYSWQLLPFFMYSTGYWLAKKIIRQQKEARVREQVRSENEKLRLENAALRAQINPHFFVNTMEYFRVGIEDTHPEIAEGIAAMTTFVGNSIVSTDESGRISLFNELRAMDSLITIFRQRYPNANIEYTNKVYDDILIIPHVLVAPVENAFKHGSFTGSNNKLAIHIEQTEEDLIFRVSNTKGGLQKDESRGIGMRYIKSQLDKFYPEQYFLKTEDKEGQYNLSLTIQNIMTHGDYLLYN